MYSTYIRATMSFAAAQMLGLSGWFCHPNTATCWLQYIQVSTGTTLVICVLSPYPKISMPFIIGKISAASWHGVPRMFSLQLIHTFFHISEASSLQHKNVWTKAKTEQEDVVLVVLHYKPFLVFLVPSTNDLLLFADLETGKAGPKQNGSKWHIQPLLYMQISWARPRHNSHDCLWGRSCPTWNWYFPHTCAFWNLGRLLHVRDWDGVLRKDSSRGAWSSPDWLHCS